MRIACGLIGLGTMLALPYGCAKDNGINAGSTRTLADGAVVEVNDNSGSNGSEDDPINLNISSDAGDFVLLDDGEICAAEVREGEKVNIDIFIMLDSSASMNEMASATDTKWQAVAQAIYDFVTDPDTADIGVGLQYFPEPIPGVPESCSAPGQCGEGGPCHMSYCSESDALCETDADCPDPDDECLRFGWCENTLTSSDPSVWLRCANELLGFNCGMGRGFCRDEGVCSIPDDQGRRIRCTGLGSTCPNGLGECQSIWGCLNRTCSVDVYASPSIPITTDPGRVDDFFDSLSTRIPEGFTPSAPALQGAIQYAQEWADSHPDRTVVTVFATDGEPTDCAPVDIQSIQAIAADGVDGDPSIPTYVIGVFSAEDRVQATFTLNRIASSGGTTQAFMVNTSEDVAAQFAETLNTIRASALSCDFQIPEPESGTLDFDKVNVRMRENGQTTQLARVEGIEDCDPNADDEWYYVKDADKMPIGITVCPNLCDRFETTTEARVDVQLGCEVLIR